MCYTRILLCRERYGTFTIKLMPNTHKTETNECWFRLTRPKIELETADTPSTCVNKVGRQSCFDIFFSLYYS